MAEPDLSPRDSADGKTHVALDSAYRQYGGWLLDFLRRVKMRAQTWDPCGQQVSSGRPSSPHRPSGRRRDRRPGRGAPDHLQASVGSAPARPQSPGGDTFDRERAEHGPQHRDLRGRLDLGDAGRLRSAARGGRCAPEPTAPCAGVSVAASWLPARVGMEQAMSAGS